MDYAWKSWSGQLPFISNCLAHHKGSIESIAEILIDFQKQIDFHLKPAPELEQVPICSGKSETGSSECAVSNEKEYGNSQDSKNLFERCIIRKLLENIKTSFLSEVGKLQMTFEKLKLSIEVTTDTLNPDSKREEVNKTYRSYLEQYIEEILGQLNDRKRENADLKDEIMELSKTADKLEAEEVTLKREIENLEKENDTQKLEITKITDKEKTSIQRTRGCESGNTAMLIFHHKDEHALPNQSSLRVLVNPEFKRFGGIFDMAFLAGKGIYPCKMNTDSFNGVMEFLTKMLDVDVL